MMTFTSDHYYAHTRAHVEMDSETSEANSLAPQEDEIIDDDTDDDLHEESEGHGLYAKELKKMQKNSKFQILQQFLVMPKKKF